MLSHQAVEIMRGLESTSAILPTSNIVMRIVGVTPYRTSDKLNTL